MFKVRDLFFDVADIVNKTFYIIQFFSDLFCESLFSNGAVGYILSYLCSIYIE